MIASRDPLLSLRVSVDYPGKPGVLRGVTLEMECGETLGLIGQSGSGKSTLALAILRLLRTKGGEARGQVCFQGRDLMQLGESEMRRLRGRRIALVPQSPLASLNPALRIGAQLREAWRAHDGAAEGWKDYAAGVMKSVSLPDDEAFMRRYPRELSVGLAQRVLIAMSILHRPPLLIADEPTSALDVITQSEILQLFQSLSREWNMGILFISHDLLSIASVCRRVAILHQGEIVECGFTEQIFREPRDPYTMRLIDALPGNPFPPALTQAS